MVCYQAVYTYYHMQPQDSHGGRALCQLGAGGCSEEIPGPFETDPSGPCVPDAVPRSGSAFPCGGSAPDLRLYQMPVRGELENETIQTLFCLRRLGAYSCHVITRCRKGWKGRRQSLTGSFIIRCCFDYLFRSLISFASVSGYPLFFCPVREIRKKMEKKPSSWLVVLRQQTNKQAGIQMQLSHASSTCRLKGRAAVAAVGLTAANASRHGE